MDIKYYTYILGLQICILLKTLLCSAVLDRPYSNITLTIREGWDLNWTCSSPYILMQRLFYEIAPGVSIYTKLDGATATKGVYSFGEVENILKSYPVHRCIPVGLETGHSLN